MERKSQHPYKATKLWNEILFAFRFGMPLKKHRRHMKIHESCFTASEATDWLHDFLQNNHCFGPHVTRNQTVQLLKKFYKSDVFEDVGKKCKKKDSKFADGHHLYRFTPILTSPQKNAGGNVRTPLAVITSKHFAAAEQRFESSYKPIEVKPLPTKYEVMPSPKMGISARPSNIHPSFAILLWRKLVFRRLMSFLGAITLDGILDVRNVSGQTIFHNMTRVNDDGVVAITDKSDDFPHWILLAMKCLARWPNASGSGSCLPNYPGFAIDVFQVVKEYLLNQSEPLIPSEHYKLFLHILFSVPSVREYLSQNESHKCDCLGPVWKNEAKCKTSTPITADGVSVDKNQLEGTSLSDILGRDDSSPRDRDTSSLLSGLIDREYSSVSIGRASSHLASCSVNHVPKQTAKSRIRRSVSLPKLHPMHSEMVRIVPWDGTDREIHVSMPIDLETVGTPGRDLTHCSYYHQDRADLAFINSYNRSYRTTPATSQISVQESSSNNLEFPQPRPYRIRKSRNGDSYCSASSSSLSDDYDDWFEPKFQSLHDLNLERENCEFINDLAASNAIAEEVFVRRGLEESEFSGISDIVPNARCQKCCHARDFSRGDQQELVKMLQVATLLLHPSERRKVHFMFQLFCKMTFNQNLVLHPHKSVKMLLMETFSCCILRAKEEPNDDNRPAAIVTGLLIDHVDEIFTPPIYLRKDFESLCRLHSEKEMRFGIDVSGGVTYCKQVSQKKYEEQKFSASKHALSQLLRDIVHDPLLTDRDRQKRLNQFKENHPDVYSSQFPPQHEKNREQKNHARINLISRIKNFRL